MAIHKYDTFGAHKNAKNERRLTRYLKVERYSSTVLQAGYYEKSTCSQARARCQSLSVVSGDRSRKPLSSLEAIQYTLHYVSDVCINKLREDRHEMTHLRNSGT